MRNRTLRCCHVEFSGINDGDNNIGNMYERNVDWSPACSWHICHRSCQDSVCIQSEQQFYSFINERFSLWMWSSQNVIHLFTAKFQPPFWQSLAYKWEQKFYPLTWDTFSLSTSTDLPKIYPCMCHRETVHEILVLTVPVHKRVQLNLIDSCW